MAKTILILAFWFLGIILCYAFVKKSIKSDHNQHHEILWGREDRIRAFIVSGFTSWVGVLIYGVEAYVEGKIDRTPPKIEGNKIDSNCKMGFSAEH